jgi:hypothetical protein
MFSNGTGIDDWVMIFGMPMQVKAGEAPGISETVILIVGSLGHRSSKTQRRRHWYPAGSAKLLIADSSGIHERCNNHTLPVRHEPELSGQTIVFIGDRLLFIGRTCGRRRHRSRVYGCRCAPIF